MKRKPYLRNPEDNTPVFGDVVTNTYSYKRFCREVGMPIAVIPATVGAYLIYKYWCWSHDHNAVAGGVRDEEKAFRAACRTFNQWEQETIDFLLDTE